MNISIVLTPSIGSVGKRGIAGTEAMFLKDTSFLQEAYNVNAFARFSFRSPNVTKIIYPVFLFDIVQKFRFSKRIFSHLSYLVEFIANLIYLFHLQLKKFHSDIYIGYSFPSIALLNRPKTIIFLHSYERVFFPNLFFSLYKKGHYIFASSFLREYYLKRYSFLNNTNTSILHNCVDINFFKPQQTPHHKEIRVLYSSAWEEVKGLHLLLLANAKLSPSLRKKITITIAGKENLWFHDKFDSNYDYLKYIHSLLDTVENVKLLGGVPPNKMPGVYNDYDFLFFTSTWGEPSSLTLIGALACGLPVVAFNVGGNMEILSKKNSTIMKDISVEGVLKELKKLVKKRGKKVRLFTSKNKNMSEEKRKEGLYKIIDQL
jgi:glycosyltransferase involved in cell wall biosynthesis